MDVPPAALMAAMEQLCPEVAADIRSQWRAPVTSYAGRLFRPVPPPTSRIGQDARAILRLTLRQRLEGRLPAGEVDAALEAFDTHAVVQAGVHSQLLLDPVTFNAFLLGWLGAVEARLPAFLVFTGTTVTMETTGKEGPGWLDLGQDQINLFGMGRHKLCRQSVCGAGPVTLNGGALVEARETMVSTAELDVVLQQGDCKWGNAADALAALNAALVSSWDSAGATMPVFFDDRHAALALARHLEDDNSFVLRLLTDPVRRQRLELALDAAAAGPFGRFMPIATTHFWGVREKRVRKLIVADGRLIEAERPNGVSIPLERSALRDALLNGILLPNLFFLFLVMSLLPRVRVLGGFRQIGYVPVFQSILLDILDREDSEELALVQDLAGHQNAWGMRVIEEPQTVFQQAADAPPGRFLAALRDRYAQTSLADATDGLRLLRESNRWRRLMRNIGASASAD